MLYLGKRDPGGLTAASPGDTLYIPLQFFNDSGASISIGSTLAVTDIELFKNGGIVERATDSGYAILGDTGNFDNRIGFKGISIQLFNTADDTGFYDEGSSYWVAIDSVTVDSRTVRFWPAVFEIGTPRANLIEINGDTGQATHLGQFADEYDTGRIAAEASATLDTGVINQAVWTADASRTLTGWSFDTGVQQAIARLDTGLRDVIADLDTGLRDHIVDYVTDTGLRDFIADIDTGLRGHIDNVDTGIHDIIVDLDTGLRDYIDNVDTGISETIDRILADTDTGIQPLTLAEIVDGIWDELDTGHGDTGTFGRLSARLAKVAADTDTGIQPLSTAQVADAVWDELDTGHADTGTYGRLSPRLAKVAADTDTGIQPPAASTIAASVWDDNDTGHGVNVRYVNEVEVGGSGSGSDPWGPA